MTDAKPGQSGDTDPDELPDGTGPIDDVASGGDDDQTEG
jgi:hypothetical protein